ncbi:protein hunchback [Elysia marginata]|uniref:Protein hunchback n=1 Tax=Elysia marginata TaxID=1093978 RepID=A0AAV4FIU9_9GAST|nr:protein hunchback [Elysia marginata]
METMAESGVLPHPHNPHPYLSASGNPSASGVHPGFFPGSSLENVRQTSPTRASSRENTQQNYPGFPRAGPTASPQPFSPFPYKQQFQQKSVSLDQGTATPVESFHPQGPGQQYLSDSGSSGFMNPQDSFGTAPDSRMFGFPRSSNVQPSSSSYPSSSQAGVLPGFRSPHQRPPAVPASQGSVPGPEDVESEMSPFVDEARDTYIGPGVSPHQYIRGDVPPNFYEKQRERYPGRDIAYGGGSPNQKQPALHESVRGFARFSNSEAEPMAYDNKQFSSSGRSRFSARDVEMKSRESLERSVSHDVQPVAWGSHLDLAREERDADGRPLRSLTLDPSLHRRHVRPESYMRGNYGERDDLYSQSPVRRSSLQHQEMLPSDRVETNRKSDDGLDSYHRRDKGHNQEEGLLMSPIKPTRALSDGGHSIGDAESAAVPQQSPNRPGPPSFQTDKLSQPMISPAPGCNKEGKPGEGAMPGRMLPKDQTPVQSQGWTPSSLGAPTDSPSGSTPLRQQGEQLNTTGSDDRPEQQRDEDEDDVDGDPKTGKSESSMEPDGNPPSSPVFPPHHRSGSFSTTNNAKENDAQTMYNNNNIDTNRRDRSPERDSAKGSGSGEDYTSFTAKRELFSEDEDEDGSQGAGSRRDLMYPGGTSSPRSMSPPSPDSSLAYPPQYPHTFFSPSRGLNPAMPFGTHHDRRHHPDTGGAGFPFGKDFPSPFPMAGMGGAPEMGGMGGLARLGPHRGRSAHPRFMNPMGGMEDENKDIYFCHLCSYSGKTKSDFDAHMSIHFEFNCPHCDYTSRTEGRLKRHIKDFHSDDSSRRSMPGRPKIYRCKQCPFSAKEKDKFWEHARSHIKEDKLLQCPKCSFVTEYKHHLEYHLRNHFGSKPFKCTKCNYSCVNKSMLNSHMKSHTNVYQYRCADCTYATKYCHSLKLHLKKYGHKPATVLNQDGSLPQGLDVDASGLSVATKRGPPRGPRGPRKDKSGGGAAGAGGDPYLSQLFGMPPVPIGVPGMGPHAMNAINPMLNGMMPFWPMLPHGPGVMSGHPQGPHHPSPSQPGMLPGMGNLAHQMRLGRPDAGMMPPHRMDHDSAHPADFNILPTAKDMSRGPALGKPQPENTVERRNGVSSEETNQRGGMMRTPEASGEEEQGKDIRRDFSMMPGGTDEEKAGFHFSYYSEKDRRMKMMDRGGFEMERRRMSEPPSDVISDNGHASNDFHRRNSLAGLLPRKGYPNHRDTPEDGVHEAWETGPAFPEREGTRRPSERYSSGEENPDEDDDRSGRRSDRGDRGTNILHQMTLKFGKDAPLERDGSVRDENSPHPGSPLGSINEDVSPTDKHQQQRPGTEGRRARRSHKETPLDLTKPKPDSPSDFDNSRSPIEYGEEHSFGRDFVHDSTIGGKEEAGKSLSKVTEILLKKRPYPEEFPDGENKSSESSSTEKAPAILPRKRSRKGKAYKLDTICLKLQEQQTSSPLDSDGNESDLETGFSGFQPLFPTPDTMDKKEESATDRGQHTESASPDEVKEKPEPDTNTEPLGQVGEVTRVISTRGDQSCDPSEVLNETKADKDHTEETVVDSTASCDSRKLTNDDEIDDEELSDFEKLQRSLKLLNGGEDATEPEKEREITKNVKDSSNEPNPCQESKDCSSNNSSSLAKTVESNSEDLSRSIKSENTENYVEQKNLSECYSDKENSDGIRDAAGSSDTNLSELGVEKSVLASDDSSIRQAKLEHCSFDSDEEIDQVDLIHTVLENRKKPLPPAVRRGTELAWKLLNDPVNPVTSLPIPVVGATSSTSTSEGASRERTRSGSPPALPTSSCPPSRQRPASPDPPLPPPHVPPYPAGQAPPISGRPMMGHAPSSPTLLRNGMRQHSPAYRQLHPYQQGHSPAVHHTHHQHYQPPPLSLHRNSHPIFPPPHYGPLPGMSSSSGSSSMKPPLSTSSSSSSSSMPIPLPPTPMAFIPPTNRMDRIQDQAPPSPGTQGGPGVIPHAKPQFPVSQQQKSELYECTYCDLTFRDCVMYTVHMGYHSNRNPFKCNSCGIICRDKVEFFLHIARSPHA